MRGRAVGWLAVLALGVPAEAQEGPRLRFEPHVVRSFDGVERPAELGRLNVEAFHGRPGAGTVELALLRLRSTAAAPGAPIVFLMGGPGIPASTMAQVPPYAALFERLRAVADVVLLDQRGTGLSRPALECPGREAPLGPHAFASRQALLDEMREQIRVCAARLRAQGVDPAAYTSREIAQDVADVRRALAAPRVNLLAYSYGTEVALAAIRREGGGGVARAALVGVRGPDHLVKLPSVFELKLRELSRLAFASPALSGELKHADELVARLERVLRSAETPLRVSVKARSTGQPVELRVGREGLQAIVMQVIDSARLPALVVSLERGDVRVLARLLEPLYNSLSGGSSLMARAVNCTSPSSRARATRAADEARTSLLGLPFDDAMVSEAYCEAIGGLQRDLLGLRPFSSDVPTLFVSGALDSQTPPAQAREVALGFSRGVHLVVANARHELLPLPGVQDAIVAFYLGDDVASRRLRAEPPAFLSVEDAATQPCGPRGC